MNTKYYKIIISLLIISILPSLIASPVFYNDQLIRSLEELDLLFEQGEISTEDYNNLVEIFITAAKDEVEEYQENIEFSKEKQTGFKILPSAKYKYHGTYLQELEKDYSYKRYHRFISTFGKFVLRTDLLSKDQQDYLFRSRSLKYKHSKGFILLGSYNLKLASGLMQGYSAYNNKFQKEADFTASITQPIKNRNNGVHLKYKTNAISSDLFLSKVVGKELTKEIYGLSLTAKHRGNSGGLIVLKQIVKNNSAKKITDYFLSPNFAVQTRNIKIEGESAFGLSASSAHLYSLHWQDDKAIFTAKFFSYGKNFHVLQSGGYAYSDYREHNIEEIDFSYRDKRNGRLGVNFESDLLLGNSGKLTTSIVRWRDRNQNIEKIAGRLVLDFKKLSGIFSEFKITTIFEDFDLSSDQSNRRLLGFMLKSQKNKPYEISLNSKIERKVSSSNKRYPFRLKFDCDFYPASILSLFLTLNYYDPDLKTNNNSYLYISVGEKVYHQKDFSLMVKITNRYLLHDSKFANWNIRFYLDFNN